MTDEEMNIYKMRITQAGIGELVVVMLEMEIQWMREALEAQTREDVEGFTECVEKARVVQVELMTVLNLDNPIAVDVYSVFAYINKQLIQSKLKKTSMDLDRLIAVLEKYLVSFREVAKTDTQGPVMVGSGKVYAGLTYGTGGLIESSMGGKEYSI